MHPPENLLSLPLDEVPFSVVDVETTGLSPVKGHRVCEVGVLRARAGQAGKGEEFSTLVDPGRPIPRGAQQVNGITNEMVRGQPAFSGVADPLLELVEDSVLVAHNAPFDLKFLWSECLTAGRRMPEVPAADTCRISRNQFQFSSNSLDDLAVRLNAGSVEHRAMSDVRATFNILETFLGELEERGIHTLEELLVAQGGDQQLTVPPSRTLDVLMNARNQDHHVSIQYVSSGGSRTERDFTPEVFCVDAHHVYVKGYCHLRNAERMFRLDRIQEVEDT